MFQSKVAMVWHALKVFLLFMGCTVFFYYGILWISEEYESMHRYDEPQGKAVKVFQIESSEEHSMKNRLLWFYRLGE
ncbi:YqzK family protein [Alkalihalobacillus pseudalcaliphilus]|uniref:YqzK family protein n=1 Tax=Alkalihalobacillus pseudalcaliphilus TaxID=79884 RepID=UPI00064E0E2F|nr:YqzK family protein [Alkalihalobacillus pseudalcaliphilus]KMK76099.1 membrane protein [Alkalihalobacillus pseudalcaliphilus]